MHGKPQSFRAQFNQITSKRRKMISCWKKNDCGTRRIDIETTSIIHMIILIIIYHHLVFVILFYPFYRQSWMNIDGYNWRKCIFHVEIKLIFEFSFVILNRKYFFLKTYFSSMAPKHFSISRLDYFALGVFFRYFRELYKMYRYSFCNYELSSTRSQLNSNNRFDKRLTVMRHATKDSLLINEIGIFKFMKIIFNNKNWWRKRASRSGKCKKIHRQNNFNDAIINIEHEYVMSNECLDLRA